MSSCGSYISTLFREAENLFNTSAGEICVEKHLASNREI